MHKNDNNTGLQASPQALTRSDELFLNRLIKNKTLHLTVDPDHIVRKWQGDRFLGYGLRSCEVEIMQPTTLRELNAMQAIAVDNNEEFDFTWHHQLMQNGQSFSPDEDLSVRLLQLLSTHRLAQWDTRTFHYLFSVPPTEAHIRAVMQALVLESRLMTKLRERARDTKKLVKI